MRVLVGLGNPGPQYEKTRHNAGFWLVDAVAAHLGWSLWKEVQGGLLAKGVSNGEEVLLFKPLGFMNQSGVPVRQLLNYYKIEPADLAVALDDVYVAPGSARLRQTGGDGGHNGLRSILQQLNPDDFWRVKIGVGLYPQHEHEKANQPALDHYVLSPLPSHDHKNVIKLIDTLVPNLVAWLEHGTLTQATVHATISKK
jgi:PTH1 family peptidyl-tRNA hydrolase